MAGLGIPKIIRLFLAGEEIEISVGSHRYGVTTALEDLERYISTDYTPYRDAIQDIRMTYPYFDFDQLHRAVELLRDADPISYQYVTDFMATAPTEIRTEDDAGYIMWILEQPTDARNRTENIFEIAFDGMERATQAERYRQVIRTYPQLAGTRFAVELERTSYGPLPFTGRTVFRLETLRDLRWLETLLYFRQGKRFARCECCWNYFIPKTKSETKYCYRPFCQEHGAQFMRRRNSDADPALAICDDMRHLLSERAARYEDAPPDKRGQLHQIDTVAFGAWSDLASRKRKEYVDGKLTAQELLRAIDTYHVLSSYDVPRPTAARKSEWRRKVESDLDFDPTKEYPSSLFIDLGKPAPQWEFTSAEEHRLEAQEGHRRLMDEYGKK